MPRALLNHPSHRKVRDDDAFCHANRTKLLLAVLVEWLGETAIRPTAARVECALLLAELAHENAVDATAGVDGLLLRRM